MKKLTSVVGWVKNYQSWEKKDYIKAAAIAAIIIIVIVNLVN
jgi:hypothetical protein